MSKPHKTYYGNTPGILDSVEQVKAFRDFLSDLHLFYDCAIPYRFGRGPERTRLTNDEIEIFRNEPECRYVVRSVGRSRGQPRIYRPFRPNLTELTHHLANQGDFTIFGTNVPRSDEILMLVDIDNKRGGADVDGAAKYVVEKYLGGHGITEPSTHRRGRHVYFKCSVYGRRRRMIREVLGRLAQVVIADPVLRATGVTFDQVFYGYPTLWVRDQEGDWRIERRGDQLRLPYINGFDLRPYQTLPCLALDFFRSQIPATTVVPAAPAWPTDNTPEGDLGVTSTRPAGRPRPSLAQGPPDTDHPDASRRRVACWSYLMRLTDGTCTPEQCVEFYESHYAFTGDSSIDRRNRLRDFQRLHRRLGRRFRPRHALPDRAHPFKNGEYDALVRARVPVAALTWDRPDRREILDHERLSDFVSIKIQDAFFEKDDPRYFGRTSRKATIACTRTLKRKGIITWVANAHLYCRLLVIALEYGLLEIFGPATRPDRTADGARQRTGRARLIGPGPALPTERAAFLDLLHEMGQARQREEAA